MLRCYYDHPGDWPCWNRFAGTNGLLGDFIDAPLLPINWHGRFEPHIDTVADRQLLIRQ
jgi:hypothetical protein